MANGIYEIRDYTIDPVWFDRYVAWARNDAAPWLAANLDVVGFWVLGGEPPVVGGSNPVVSPNGQPNVTWILRWPDRATRDIESRARLAPRVGGPSRASIATGMRTCT
jgi:hypothetical protein